MVCYSIASKMSATEQMAQMLNELMGVKRNADIGDTDEPDFDEPDVCKNFLVAFCPNEMFRNTKADLGFCPKVVLNQSNANHS